MASQLRSSWPEAGGSTSLQAADAICRTEAKSAGLARSESFKAWLSSSFGNARSRFAEDGPLYRPDGVRVIASLAGLASGVLDAPIELDATGAPTLYNEAWTGTRANGDASFACNDWTSSADQAGGITGLGSAAGHDWVEFDAASGCPNTGIHLYCIGDNDSLFLAGFE